MAGKRMKVTLGKQPAPSRLTLLHLDGRDTHGKQLGLYSCLPNHPLTTHPVYKVASLNTLSCGCLKKEKFLAYHRKRARALSPGIRATIFADRCAGVDAFDLAGTFDIPKASVDAVVNKRQAELRCHTGFEAVKKSVIAHTEYPGVDQAAGMLPHEVRWLARDIRSAMKLEAARLAVEVYDAPELESDLRWAFVILEIGQDILQRERRGWFHASEWSASMKWQPRKPHASGKPYFDVMLPYRNIDLLKAAATTSERRGLLTWLETTITATEKHRKKERGIRARDAGADRVAHSNILPNPSLLDAAIQAG